jgi:hypothetical protein
MLSKTKRAVTTYCFHLRCRNFLYLDNISNSFLRNVAKEQPVYAESHPKRRQLSQVPPRQSNSGYQFNIIFPTRDDIQ